MYTFTKLHDRHIPKVGVRVGVGPMEFQLYSDNRQSRVNLETGREMIVYVRVFYMVRFELHIGGILT